jgi:hypothetical protein
MPLQLQPGRWELSVICFPGDLTAKASFIVGTPLKPAQITVAKSGLSTESDGMGGTFMSCGLALVNSSSESDVRDIGVTVQFIGTLGRSAASTEVDLTLIPAGQTFYASCLTLANVTISVASLNVSVTVGKSVPKKAQLPPVSNVTVTAPDDIGGQTITGQFTNPYATAMPEDATIYAVYFDASGNIVDGSWNPTGASVQPGATVGFQFDTLSENVASAQVSVDPCGPLALSCPVG